ncbi:MAG: hypothetical protein LWY06_08765, partial [Firmicutes bacterium]|nr:hypothetical protein [Bacillota bacterium]
NSCNQVFLYAVLPYIRPDISQGFINSIYKGLKKGGKLVVLNNIKLQENAALNLKLIPRSGFRQIEKKLPQNKDFNENGYMLIIFEKL